MPYSLADNAHCGRIKGVDTKQRLHSHYSATARYYQRKLSGIKIGSCGLDSDGSG